MRGRFRERLPKQRRTIPIPARDGDAGREKTDQGNYFRCWHCGFICDVRRDALSEEGRHGATTEEATTAGSAATLYRDGDARYLDSGLGFDIVLMKLDSTGSAATVKRTLSVTGQGCPLCHSRAWKKV